MGFSTFRCLMVELVALGTTLRTTQLYSNSTVRIRNEDSHVHVMFIFIMTL